MASYEWIISGPVRARADGNGVVVEEVPEDRRTGFRSARLTYCRDVGATEGVLRINNCYADVGDDLPCFLGLMDEAARTDPEWVYDQGDPDDHDCPKANFLDDPITEAYGVGYEMVGLISCPVCEARERES